MKKAHRNAHRVIWVLLLPALVCFVFFAQQGKPGRAPTVEAAPYPSTVGDLP